MNGLGATVDAGLIGTVVIVRATREMRDLGLGGLIGVVRGACWADGPDGMRAMLLVELTVGFMTLEGSNIARVARRAEPALTMTPGPSAGDGLLPPWGSSRTGLRGMGTRELAMGDDMVTEFHPGSPAHLVLSYPLLGQPLHERTGRPLSNSHDVTCRLLWMIVSSILVAMISRIT